MIDWDDVKYFLAVARHGSTLAAGRALKVNQSTVHRRLIELERRTGCRLVERHPTGYRLTEIGQEMVAHAERIDQSVQLFEQRLDEFKRDVVGVVRNVDDGGVGLGQQCRVDRTLIEGGGAQQEGALVVTQRGDGDVDRAPGVVGAVVGQSVGNRGGVEPDGVQPVVESRIAHVATPFPAPTPADCSRVISTANSARDWIASLR